MKSDRPVAIVGGGFSGTMVAAHLARRGIPSVVIDGSGRMGRGTAYSTVEPAHLLNVRAEAMSAWPDQREDFARRFAAEGGEPQGFAQRRLFGLYLREILDRAIASGNVETVAATACAARQDDGGWSVTLDSGRSIAARGLVLATGNEQPEAPAGVRGAGAHFIANPWGEEAQAAIAELAQTGGDALIVGTGLTMVDLALSLDAAGYGGRIFALSRRGLIPRGHARFEPAPVALEDVPQGNVRALLRWLRRRGASAGWRAAVDSLRPHSQSLWQSLGADEQRRFLRHARPWWDVHRHRIAPDVAATIARMVGEGRLEIAAGRIASMEESGEGLLVRYRRRGRSALDEASFAFAFNCTGPLQSVTGTSDPLMRSLLDAGAATPDPLGIGLAVDGRSRVSGARDLWALGSLTKALHWEIIAVPDIREQAAAVAEDIAQELGQ
jgi:uncharacterized NAD(P)/FAD-binding protein YdhS